MMFIRNNTSLSDPYANVSGQGCQTLRQTLLVLICVSRVHQRLIDGNGVRKHSDVGTEGRIVGAQSVN